MIPRYPFFSRNLDIFKQISAPYEYKEFSAKRAGLGFSGHASRTDCGKTLPNTILVTSNQAVEEDKGVIEQIVKAHNEAVTFINENPEEAKRITVDSIKEITNQELDKDVVESAWSKITYTTNVDSETIQAFANSSHDLKFLKEKPDFANLIDLQFISKYTASVE